jgi:hypothetical protein
MRSHSHSAPFRLSKWYLDCISENGQTVIGYHAAVEWKSLSLSYASCLHVGAQEAGASTTSLFREDPPQITNDGVIQWRSNKLACSGEWHPQCSDSIPPQCLYDDETGFLTWQCHRPLAEARVRMGDSEVRGLGYVEFLEMTIPPWKLPIDELHWGRFLSQNAYHVWIVWRGPHPLTLVFLNGVRLSGVEVSETTVTWAGGRLALDDRSVLRNGSLGQTVLAAIPGADRLIPGTVLDTEECKWRSRGTLSDKGATHTGWVIHEVVKWG